MQTGDIANAAWSIPLEYRRSDQFPGRRICDVVLSKGPGIEPNSAHQLLLVRVAQALKGARDLRRRELVDFLPKLLPRNRQIELGRTGIAVRGATLDNAARLQSCDLATP